jgi:hypothetical protein
MNDLKLNLETLFRKKHNLFITIQKKCKEFRRTERQKENIITSVKLLYIDPSSKRKIQFTNVQRHTLGYRKKRTINTQAIRKKRAYTKK